MNPLVMIDMKSKLKGNANEENNLNQKQYKPIQSNLSSIENNLIKNIIHREAKLVEKSVEKVEYEKTQTKVITLEEAVKQIRKGC